MNRVSPVPFCQAARCSQGESPMNTATRQPAAIGPYRVVDVSGEGGMGRVYRAVHTTRHQVVAIKVLNNTVHDDKALARMLNEARIHSGLHHPNIVRFYELLE